MTTPTPPATRPRNPEAAHEHSFGLVLGMSGHGLIYGDFEGYVRRCGGMGSGGCGEYAPDYVAYRERRQAERIAEARRVLDEVAGAVR